MYPKDDKITHEWVLELINRMKDMENKKSNGAKYIDKVYLLQMLLKVKNPQSPIPNPHMIFTSIIYLKISSKMSLM